MATEAPLPKMHTKILRPLLREASNIITTAKPKQVAIDAALPGRHTKALYDNRKFKEAVVLCQMRTGRSRLNADLFKIGATNTDQCDCSESRKETVRHFLFDCPQWIEQRGPLLEVAASRWGDLSFFLGGMSLQKTPTGELLDGPPDKWKPDLQVVTRTIEFAIRTGRLI